MNVTKGIFTAVHQAVSALSDEPQDPMRVQYAMEHLEFCTAIARAADAQSRIDEVDTCKR